MTAYVHSCSRCGKEGLDRIGLSFAGTTPLDMEELGFCSLDCFVRYVRDRWMVTT